MIINQYDRFRFNVGVQFHSYLQILDRGYKIVSFGKRLSFCQACRAHQFVLANVVSNKTATLKQIVHIIAVIARFTKKAYISTSSIIQISNIDLWIQKWKCFIYESNEIVNLLTLFWGVSGTMLFSARLLSNRVPT